jgi:hypothetical protein
MTEKTLASPIEGIKNDVDVAHSHEADWFFAEGIPGTGVRPDYLESKYKSVADQARAYKEAQKLIGSANSAPESYELGDLTEHIDRDNPHIVELMNHAKESRLPQDAFGKIIKSIVDYDNSRKPDTDKEIAKLGADGANKINVLQNWIKNNLSEGSAKALENLPVKAEVVNMLDELRQLHINTQSKIPGDVDKAATFKVLTVAEVEAEMLANYSRYQNDPGYRAQISAKFEQAVGG